MENAKNVSYSNPNTTTYQHNFNKMKINLFQQKGKAPTKGAKQILLENSVTLNFYRNMSLVAIAAYGVVTTCLYLEDLTTGVIVSCIKTTTKPTYLVVFI